MLADDGLLYVEVPGVMSLHERRVYAFDYLRYVTHAHIYHFNLVSLADQFSRAGFELVYGNEEVEAVFRKGPCRVERTGNAANILAYLRFLETIREDLGARHDRITTLERRTRWLKDVIAEREVQIRELDEARRQAENEHRKAVMSHHRTIKELDRVLASKSWAATEPFRDVLRLLRRFRNDPNR